MTGGGEEIDKFERAREIFIAVNWPLTNSNCVFTTQSLTREDDEVFIAISFKIFIVKMSTKPLEDRINGNVMKVVEVENSLYVLIFLLYATCVFCFVIETSPA